MRISSFSAFLFCFTAINTSTADFTKVQLHLHVEYISNTEACVTCWPKNRNTSDGYHASYYLYEQANPDKFIVDRGPGPCNKSLSLQSKTAHLSVQQGVMVGCGEHGRLDETSINVTLFPLSGDDEDFIINTPGIDSHMLLKCNSTLDHNGSCWKLSLTHISNKDAYCNASNNSFGIISIFPPSLYSDIESEKGVPILLRALEFGYNFDESENSCVKVTGSVPQDLDFFPSVTPVSARLQTPWLEPVTDALNQLIQDKPTYVLVSFPVLVAMFVLLVLAIVIILILAICLCKHKWRTCKAEVESRHLEVICDNDKKYPTNDDPQGAITHHVGVTHDNVNFSSGEEDNL